MNVSFLLTVPVQKDTDQRQLMAVRSIDRRNTFATLNEWLQLAIYRHTENHLVV
jgi:hypothetical protein